MDRAWSVVTTGGVTQCSNGGPDADGESFNTLLDCCEATFGFGVQCEYTDICETDDDGFTITVGTETTSNDTPTEENVEEEASNDLPCLSETVKTYTDCEKTGEGEACTETCRDIRHIYCGFQLDRKEKSAHYTKTCGDD